MNLSRIRNYWNKQPCNIKYSTKKKFSKKYFEEITNKKYFVEKHIPNFAEFNKYKKKNVLEIGCGIGTDAIQFIKNGANYTGIDYSDESIKILKKRIKVLNLKNKNKKIFLIATGKQYSVKEFINLVCKELNIKIIWKGKNQNVKGYWNKKPIIQIDQKYYRPTEVNSLRGDFSLAKKELGWKPKTQIKTLIKVMVYTELKSLK